MTLVVFKTKTEVFAFIEDIRYLGISASVVSTPKEIKIGCGLSAKISDNGINVAKRIIYNGDYPTFYGIFIKKLGTANSSLTKIF